MTELLQKIFTFSYEEKPKKKWKSILKLFGLGLLIHFFASALLSTIAGYFIEINRSQHPASVLIQEVTEFWKLALLFLFVAIIDPITEEVSYRMCISQKIKEFSYGVAFAISFFFVLFLKPYKSIELHHELGFFLFLAGIAFPLGFLLLKLASYFEVRINLKIMAVLSSFLFALIHLNIIADQVGFIPYAILLFPYFLTGLLFSYARVTMGMFECCLLHSLNNGFFFLLNALIKG